MKWTTYDEQWGSLPRQGEDVLVVLSCGRTVLARIGFGDTEWILERGGRTILASGDRWLPLSAITPERLEAVSAVIDSSRECIASYIKVFGMMQRRGRNGNTYEALEEDIAKIDALGAK